MLRVGLVGGGIGGLAAALALRAAGHEVRVFEQAKAITEVGSGLTLWANATRALRHLGVLGDCLSTSQEVQVFHLRTSSGRRLMRIPLESFATTPVVMHRSDLQAALLKALPASCLNIKERCLAVREDQGGVHLRFASGEQGPFDLVVGADGLRSVVRSYVGASGAPDFPSYQGYVVWRGVATGVALPDAPGSISETWGRGHRFGILPMGQGRVCWYATANQALREPTPLAERQRRVSSIVAGWHRPIDALVRATPSAAILENPAFDRPVTGAWTRGATVLLGDAAHPLTPNLGQGACMALEDAVVLGELLRSVPERRALSEALRQFEALRQERLRSMARRCRVLGALGQWQNRWLTPVRNQVAALIPGAYFAYTSRAIQSYAAELAAAESWGPSDQALDRGSEIADLKGARVSKSKLRVQASL